MITIEDRLRAAARAAADTVARGSAAPLRLPDRRVAFLRRRRGRRWPGLLIPLAAAVSVIAVVAATLAIGHGLPRHHAPATPASRRAALLASLPPYYLTLAGAIGPTFRPAHAVIRSTTTGAVLSTVRPPRPYRTFDLAAAAGDGRTFVLGAGKWRVTHRDGGTLIDTSPTRFFLLRLTARGAVARLTPLSIPAVAAEIEGIALSPDGSKLAEALRGSATAAGNPSIRVITLASGAEQTWTWPAGGPVTNNAGGNGQVLSWAADDRTLAFQQWAGDSIDIRLLNTTTPGGSLQSASRLVVQWAHDAETWHFVHGKVSNVIFGFSALLTQDGRRIVAATASETKRPLSSELGFTEFSAGTGQVVDQLGRWRLGRLYPGQTQDVLWSNSSGSKLIVVAHKPGKPVSDPRSRNEAGYSLEFGVQTRHGFLPLPGAPPATGPGSWPVW